MSGSFCLSGEGLQRAEAVGASSYAHSLTSAARQWVSSRTPLQQRIDLVVRVVMLVVALMSAVILMQAALEGLPLIRVVQISAVLSGLVPYGLFFLVTLSYAVGAATIARRGAIVQQINAVESLSHVDVICLDKTGTLTSGALHLDHVLAIDGCEEDASRSLLGSFATSAGQPNATTAALVARLGGTALPVGEEVPFSSARRWSALAFDGPDRRGVYILGAVDALAPYLQSAATLNGTELTDAAAGLAVQGLRVLLFACAIDDLASLHDETGAPRVPQLSLMPEVRGAARWRVLSLSQVCVVSSPREPVVDPCARV